MTKFFVKARTLFLKLALNPLFIIKIENGVVSKVSGNVKNSFMADCFEIAKRNQLEFGLVYAIKDSYGNAILKTSVQIPNDILQQFRNA